MTTTTSPPRPNPPNRLAYPATTPSPKSLNPMAVPFTPTSPTTRPHRSSLFEASPPHASNVALTRQCTDTVEPATPRKDAGRYIVPSTTAMTTTISHHSVVAEQALTATLAGSTPLTQMGTTLPLPSLVLSPTEKEKPSNARDAACTQPRYTSSAYDAEMRIHSVSAGAASASSTPESASAPPAQDVAPSDLQLSPPRARIHALAPHAVASPLLQQSASIVTSPPAAQTAARTTRTSLRSAAKGSATATPTPLHVNTAPSLTASVQSPLSAGKDANGGSRASTTRIAMTSTIRTPQSQGTHHPQMPPSTNLGISPDTTDAPATAVRHLSGTNSSDGKALEDTSGCAPDAKSDSPTSSSVNHLNLREWPLLSSSMVPAGTAPSRSRLAPNVHPAPPQPRGTGLPANASMPSAPSPSAGLASSNIAVAYALTLSPQTGPPRQPVPAATTLSQPGLVRIVNAPTAQALGQSTAGTAPSLCRSETTSVSPGTTTPNGLYHPSDRWSQEPPNSEPSSSLGDLVPGTDPHTSPTHAGLPADPTQQQSLSDTEDDCFGSLEDLDSLRVTNSESPDCVQGTQPHSEDQTPPFNSPSTRTPETQTPSDDVETELNFDNEIDVSALDTPHRHGGQPRPLHPLTLPATWHEGPR